jgi:hypothetical protein
LSQAYRSLSPDEQDVVDTLLAEWVVSDDDRKRFASMALIREYNIVSALTALQELVRQLDESLEPSAPYDLSKANRVIAQITSSHRSDESADAARQDREHGETTKA